jgi:hypothetical protein
MQSFENYRIRIIYKRQEVKRFFYNNFPKEFKKDIEVFIYRRMSRNKPKRWRQRVRIIDKKWRKYYAEHTKI